MPLYKYDGGLLKVGGALAASEDCCCVEYTCDDQCYGCCFGDEATIDVTWDMGFTPSSDDADCSACDFLETGSVGFVHATHVTTCTSGTVTWTKVVGDLTYALTFGSGDFTGTEALFQVTDATGDRCHLDIVRLDANCCEVTGDIALVHVRALDDASCNTGTATTEQKEGASLEIVITNGCCYDGMDCVAGVDTDCDGECD